MRTFHILPTLFKAPVGLNVRYADELTTLSDIERQGHLNPIQKSRLDQLRAMGKTGNAQGITGASDGVYTEEGAHRAAQKRAMEAIDPAVKSLEAGIPETSNIYSGVRDRLEATRTPLNQRYDALLQSLKDEQTGAKNSAQMTTSRELGRRGIPLSSTLADQEISGVVNPILAMFANSISQTGIAQGADNLNLSNMIADTADDETRTIRDIRNAIANAQSQAGMGAISTALQMLQAQESTRQFDVTSALQRDQLAQSAINRQVITANGRKYLIDGNTGEVIRDLGLAEVATGSGNTPLIPIGDTTTTTTGGGNTAASTSQNQTALDKLIQQAQQAGAVSAVGNAGPFEGIREWLFGKVPQNAPKISSGYYGASGGQLPF